MGLYLLSTTVAHDFGAIGALDMAKRLEDTLETIRLIGEHVIPKIDRDPVHRTTRFREAAAQQ